MFHLIKQELEHNFSAFRRKRNGVEIFRQHISMTHLMALLNKIITKTHISFDLTRFRMQFLCAYKKKKFLFGYSTSIYIDDTHNEIS